MYFRLTISPKTCSMKLKHETFLHVISAYSTLLSEEETLIVYHVCSPRSPRSCPSPHSLPRQTTTANPPVCGSNRDYLLCLNEWKQCGWTIMDDSLERIE